MKRRGFLQAIFGGAAAATVAPEVLKAKPPKPVEMTVIDVEAPEPALDVKYQAIGSDWRVKNIILNRYHDPSGWVNDSGLIEYSRGLPEWSLDVTWVGEGEPLPRIWRAGRRRLGAYAAGKFIGNVILGSAQIHAPTDTYGEVFAELRGVGEMASGFQPALQEAYKTGSFTLGPARPI